MAAISGFWVDADTNASVRPHQLCGPCEKFCSSSNLLRTLPQDYAKWEHEQKNALSLTLRPAVEESFSIHAYSDLCNCVSEGKCHLCAIIWHELRAQAGRDPLAELRNSESDGVFLTGVVRGGGKSFINHCLLSFALGERRVEVDIPLLLSDEPHTASTREQFPAQLALSTESDATIELSKKWLFECIFLHGACSTERKSAIWETKLPTRLISVNGQGLGATKPCVVDSENLAPTTSYLTLSHSWGDSKFLKLLSTNKAQLYSSLEVGDLSQTHKDSLCIARRLGYQYIWIDSLCIIQDSQEDWKAESAQMASIYGNSTCNIAAENWSPKAGCFTTRNALMQRPCQLTRSNEADQAAGVYAHPYHTANWSAFADYYYSSVPLLRRAWVQQERILSPRVLYFGGPEIHWECCSLQASETWPHGPPDDEPGFDEVYPLKAAFESHIKPFVQWDREDLNRFVYELWHHGAFRDYTAAKLTYEKDRLVALAGVASVVQQRTGMTYLAGMWKELLPQELMWRNIDEPVAGQKRWDGMPWKAPTWSWASVPGRKRFDLSAMMRPEEPNVLYVSRVLDCVVSPSGGVGPSILGEVLGGVITLTGFLLLLPPPPPRDAKTSSSARNPRGLISLDIEVSPSSELFYFCLMKTVDNEATRTNRGLILAKAEPRPAAGDDDENHYVRVGVFVRSHKVVTGGLFDGLEETTVSIV